MEFIAPLWSKNKQRIVNNCNKMRYGQNKSKRSLLTEIYIATDYEYLRGIFCKISVRVGHGTSPTWLKFCMQSCFGVLNTKWLFQSSGKFYFESFDHGLFRSAPKGSQNSESKVILLSSVPTPHPPRPPHPRICEALVGLHHHIGSSLSPQYVGDSRLLSLLS